MQSGLKIEAGPAATLNVLLIHPTHLFADRIQRQEEILLLLFKYL